MDLEAETWDDWETEEIDAEEYDAVEQEGTIYRFELEGQAILRIEDLEKALLVSMSFSTIFGDIKIYVNNIQDAYLCVKKNAEWINQADL